MYKILGIFTIIAPYAKLKLAPFNSVFTIFYIYSSMQFVHGISSGAILNINDYHIPYKYVL